MEKGLRYGEAISSLVRRQIFEGLDAWLRSLDLLERSRRVQRMVDLAIGGIEVEPMPPCLDAAHRAILVSNYPSVSQTLRAVLKVGCRLPGAEFRLKGIGRPEVVTHASSLLKALGIANVVFPVHKDEAAAYRLHRKVVQEVLAFLDGPGHVLWMSITGRTRGNGLSEGDLRSGAALFCLNKGVPLVPMGLVTREQEGRFKVVKVRFGEPINPPEVGEMGDFEKSDFLIDFSKLALCQTAKLLPPGQRGDFENFEEKLEETERRLRMHQLGDRRRNALVSGSKGLRGEP